MKRQLDGNRAKWLTGLLIAAVLTLAFFWGDGPGGGQRPSGEGTTAAVSPADSSEADRSGAASGAATQRQDAAGADEDGAEPPGDAPEHDGSGAAGSPPEEASGASGREEAGSAGMGADAAEADGGSAAGRPAGGGEGAQGGQAGSGGAAAGPSGAASGGPPSPGPKQTAESSGRPPAATPPAKPTASASPAAGGGEKDRYLTDPVPEGKPKPVEWQDAAVDKTKPLTVTLSVSAETVLDNMDIFNKDKLEVLPEDGIIFPAQTVTFYEGESVFDVLLREMKNNKIHMEFEMTPIYNSNYIEGIHNIYEFDCGELSGWMYKVNGWFPNYGSSRYALQDGDVVEWVYTCDLGRDVGGGVAAGDGS